MGLSQPVVVLGGGGFIGANLVRRLTGEGCEVRAVDVAWPAWRAEALRGADRYTLDLTDPAKARAAVAGAGTVFHLAADMGGVGYFHSDADLGASITNGRITANVVEACAAEGVHRLFYAASACAYPVERMRPGARALTESELGFGTPDALYGAEKLHGIRLCGKLPFARVGVLDTIYGPGAEWEGRRAKFPAAVAVKALHARRSGQLELWGDGNQRRSFCYIDDAVTMILRVATADRYAGPVNIAARGTITCREAAQLCLSLVGVPDAEIVTNPAEPSGVLARECSTAKFERLYGTPPATTYAAGFGELLDWLDAQHA